MTTLVIDIETIPDETTRDWFDLYVQPEQKVADSWTGLSEIEYDLAYSKWRVSQMSLSPEYCKIVGLSWLPYDNGPVSRWVGELIYGDKIGGFVETDTITEPMLLAKFWQLATKYGTIITYNGLGFDLEVLKWRSAVLGVSATCDLSNLKPWENRVVDLMKRLYATRKSVGLKKVTNILSGKIMAGPRFEPYQDIMHQDGSSVFEEYFVALATGDWNVLKRYGELDVLRTGALYEFGLGYWW